MKKLSILLVAAAFAFAGCIDLYDDSLLSGRVDDLEERVSDLEERCDMLNANIISLQAIVNALQGNDYIVSITPVKKNDEEIGYTIVFAKADPITIYHGEDGKDGHTPVIGVRMHTDGIYYWTLDGEWLLDDKGDRIKAQGLDGKDGITPQLKIENGYWYVSYDNGATWKQLGKATGEDGKDGDSFFREVRQDDGYVYFVLADGTELSVPKSAPLSITFDTGDLVAMEPNSVRDINYTVTSPCGTVKVEAIASADLKAKVVEKTSKTGAVNVRTSEKIDEYSKVVVLVADDSKVIMHTLKFAKGEIEIKGEAEQVVTDKGGNISLYYLSNTDCDVIIPDGVDWIHVVSTKALQEHEIVLSLDSNPGKERSANVIVRSDAGRTLTYTITQNANENIHLLLEREALVEFYKATGGDNWTNNTNWCSDKPVDDWYGIATNADGRIMELVLGENGLTGTIPESIGNLADLYYLNLSDNRLTGSVPETIINLTRLKTIYLDYNMLSGQIPESLTKTELWQKSWINIMNGNQFNTENLYIPAPSFDSVTTIDGKTVSDRIYGENELTVLFQWRSWCPYCQAFAPTLLNLYNEYKAKGLEVLSYSSEDTETIKTFINSFGLSWNTFRYGQTNPDFVLHCNFIPAVNVVDKNGEIIFNCVYDNRGSLEDFIIERLGEDLYASTDFSADGKVTILQTAKEGNGIDIVLMGDAYSDRMIADGTYGQVMRKAADFLFTEEPFKSYKDLFNIYMVNVVSTNEKIGRNTALQTYFGDGTFVGGDNKKCSEYATNAISPERANEAMIVVMLNSTKYAGTCHMYYGGPGHDYGYGKSISYFPTGVDDAAFENVLHHEANGHGFAKLSDEYAYESQGRIPETVVEDEIFMYETYGWNKNVDYTNDWNTVRWNRFLSDSRYANDGLGVFEGGSTYWSGVWRPTEDSIMRHNTGGFNAPSREAIYYRIHKLAYGNEWQYDYEEFVKYDEVNRNKATKSGVPYRFEEPENFVPLAPPVIIRETWRESQD